MTNLIPASLPPAAPALPAVAPLSLLWEDGFGWFLLGVYASVEAAQAQRPGTWTRTGDTWSRPARKRSKRAREFRIDQTALADGAGAEPGDTLHLLWRRDRKTDTLIGVFRSVQAAQAHQPGEWYERDGAPGWTQGRPGTPQFTLDPVILGARAL